MTGTTLIDNLNNQQCATDQGQWITLRQLFIATKCAQCNSMILYLNQQIYLNSELEEGHCYTSRHPGESFLQIERLANPADER